MITNISEAVQAHGMTAALRLRRALKQPTTNDELERALAKANAIADTHPVISEQLTRELGLTLDFLEKSDA